MHLLSLLALGLVGQAAAAPSLFTRDEDPQIRAFSIDEIHDNVLKTYPPELIISSDQLENFQVSHDNETLVYLKDTRSWTTTVVHDAYSKLEARQQACNPVAPTYKVVSAQSYWDPWTPLSDCTWTGSNQGGATRTLEWGYSISYAWNVGLSANEQLWGIMGASLGFSVTKTYSTGGSLACNILASQKVGQIWGRHRMGWTEIETTKCQCAGQVSPCNKSRSWVTAPEKGAGANPSCSAGENKVSC